MSLALGLTQGELSPSGGLVVPRLVVAEDVARFVAAHAYARIHVKGRALPRATSSGIGAFYDPAVSPPSRAGDRAPRRLRVMRGRGVAPAERLP